jgi:protease-4
MVESEQSDPIFPAATPLNQPYPIVIRQDSSGGLRKWIIRILMFALFISIMLNFGMFAQYRQYFAGEGPLERYRSGEKKAKAKIAVIEVSGTIMPPFTKRILQSIKKAKNDDAVKGVVLVVDSPGGLVADSHQIYHRLQELSQQKPIFVSMKRMAASGGYYIAMGAGSEGRIYAEPTTWTGSIGVIIPRYDVSKLAEKWQVKSDPLKTGPFKDALSPFRELSDAEREVWTTILDDAFQRFLNVIADNRDNLDYPAVKELATGQIYTADQALKSGLVDKIGYEDDVIKDLQQHLELETVRVVSYHYPPAMLEVLTGTASAQQPKNQWQKLLDATVPRAMYLCSWAPGIPEF